MPPAAQLEALVMLRDNLLKLAALAERLRVNTPAGSWSNLVNHHLHQARHHGSELALHLNRVAEELNIERAAVEEL